jgi:hypothetical protein
MQTNKLFLGVLGSVLAMPALAETPASAVPTLAQVLDASGVSLSGHIDTSYTALSGKGMFTSGTADRVFDANRNSFNVQAVDLTVSKLPAEGIGGLVDVTLGKDAAVIASSGTLTSLNQTYDLTQAYLQYASGGLTVTGGKFATDTGAEVIKATGNTNFSRSILFGYAIPFTHTGMRATYKFSDTLSVTGGVNNGWDEVVDIHPNKTVELGAVLSPAKAFTLSVMDHRGVEQVVFGAPGIQGNRNLLDVVATITATDNLNFVVNYDNGSQENGGNNGAPVPGTTAKWDGWAAYANYQFSELWRVSVRGETFSDKNGYRTGVTQKWKEGTLTLAYMPSKSAELRGEIRKDSSDVASFQYTDGINRKSQSSVGLEAIYKF